MQGGSHWRSEGRATSGDEIITRLPNGTSAEVEVGSKMSTGVVVVVVDR
jgi:hypothetical protein